MRLEAAGGVLVDARYKAKERGLSSTVMTNQGHTSTLANGHGNVLQGRDDGTATTATEATSGYRSDKRRLQRARFCSERQEFLDQHSLVQARAAGPER